MVTEPIDSSCASKDIFYENSLSWVSRILFRDILHLYSIGSIESRGKTDGFLETSRRTEIDESGWLRRVDDVVGTFTTPYKTSKDEFHDWTSDDEVVVVGSSLQSEETHTYGLCSKHSNEMICRDPIFCDETFEDV
jgi:hypothetical protein